MLWETLTGAAVLAASALIYARMRRAHLYQDLGARLATVTDEKMLPLEPLSRMPLPGFQQRIAAIPNFLPANAFAGIKQEILACAVAERNYVPSHKKGGTVAYETLIAKAPRVAALYHSPAFQNVISRLTGVEVKPTPLNDQSSLSVLCYEQPGDHIGWHFDHNFYRGRHFTILLPILNEGRAEGGVSHCRLKAKIEGRETDFDTAPNTLIVFEGAKILHKATPLLEGERRIVLSMTYCADPRAAWWQGAARRIKDIAFFGPRALWT